MTINDLRTFIDITRDLKLDVLHVTVNIYSLEEIIEYANKHNIRLLFEHKHMGKYKLLYKCSECNKPQKNIKMCNSSDYYNCPNDEISYTCFNCGFLCTSIIPDDVDLDDDDYKWKKIYEFTNNLIVYKDGAGKKIRRYKYKQDDIIYHKKINKTQTEFILSR